MDVNGEPDPLSLPMSPLPTGSETPGGSIPDEGDRGRPAVKWVRTKKPLRDLLGKIMVELRRKDEVSLASASERGVQLIRPVRAV